MCVTQNISPQSNTTAARSSLAWVFLCLRMACCCSELLSHEVFFFLFFLFSAGVVFALIPHVCVWHEWEATGCSSHSAPRRSTGNVESLLPSSSVGDAPGSQHPLRYVEIQDSRRCSMSLLFTVTVQTALLHFPSSLCGPKRSQAQPSCNRDRKLPMIQKCQSFVFYFFLSFTADSRSVVWSGISSWLQAAVTRRAGKQAAACKRLDCVEPCQLCPRGRHSQDASSQYQACNSSDALPHTRTHYTHWYEQTAEPNVS